MKSSLTNQSLIVGIPAWPVSSRGEWAGSWEGWKATWENGTGNPFRMILWLFRLFVRLLYLDFQPLAVPCFVSELWFLKLLSRLLTFSRSFPLLKSTCILLSVVGRTGDRKVKLAVPDGMVGYHRTCAKGKKDSPSVWLLGRLHKDRDEYRINCRSSTRQMKEMAI